MAHGEGAAILPDEQRKRNEDWLNDYGFHYNKTIFGWIKHPNNYSSLIVTMRDDGSVTAIYVTEGKKIVAENEKSPSEAIFKIQQYVGVQLL